MTDTPTSAAPGRLLTLAMLLLASTTIMSNATIAPSLPGIKAHFAATPGIETLAPLLLSLPSISIVLTAGLFGWLADRTNRQPLLLIAGLLALIGGTSGLWANTMGMLLVGRVVLGIGVGGTMTLAMTWGADLWQGPARARYMGMQGAAMSGGGVLVLVLGGALAQLGWRGSFAVYLVILPIILLALYALAPTSRRMEAERLSRPKGRVDTGESFPWGVYLFCGTLAFLFMAAFYIMPTRVPFLLTALGTANPLVIGLIMALVTLTSVPGALGYGRIRRRFSALAVFALSFGMMALGLLLVGTAQAAWQVALGGIVAGLGMGPSLPNFTTYFNGFLSHSQRGRGNGLLTMAFFAGQFASPLLTAPLVAGFGLPRAFEVTAVLMALVSGVMVVLALRAPRADADLVQAR